MTWQKAKLPKPGSFSYQYLGSIANGAGGDMTLVMRAFQNEPAPGGWHSTDGLNWKSIKWNAQVFSWAGVATVGDAFVAVDPNGGTMLSKDGVKWKATKKGIKDAHADTVTCTASGAAVAGSDGDGAAVWTTVDGKDWSRAALPADAKTVTTMAAAPSGLLAAGSWFAPGLWIAPDGVTWQSVPLPLMDADSHVFSLIATNSGLLLVVDQVDGTGGAVSSTIWSSVDGLDWQQVLSSDSPVRATSFGPLGAILVTDATMLQSSDEGATWSETPLAPDFNGAALTLLAQTPDGHLLAGGKGPEPAMWLGTAAP